MEDERRRLHEYGKVLADIDDKLNRTLRETGGDEIEAYDRLQREDEAPPPESD